MNKGNFILGLSSVAFAMTAGLAIAHLALEPGDPVRVVYLIINLAAAVLIQVSNALK